MNNLRNYITERIIIAERIRVDNIKPNDINGVFEIPGKLKWKLINYKDSFRGKENCG
jgi:hypothetical protein